MFQSALSSKSEYAEARISLKGDIWGEMPISVTEWDNSSFGTESFLLIFNKNFRSQISFACKFSE